VSRALQFLEQGGKYFSIGKLTVWTEDEVDDFDSERDYEQNPPEPKNTDTILDILGYKKVEFCSLVVPDNAAGTLEYRGTKWRIVNKEQAYSEGARWVYLSVELTYDELPVTVPYRQVGVHTGVQLREDVNPSKYAVLPEEVDDNGILEILDNRKPVYRDADVREKIKIILEF
jgi:hypothetical protein